jgi:hypothetical protein
MVSIIIPWVEPTSGWRRAECETVGSHQMTEIRAQITSKNDRIIVSIEEDTTNMWLVVLA